MDNGDMPWTEQERDALVETLLAADPEAPTLCEGWSVHRLLAHLVLREHQPHRVALDAGAAPGSEPQLGELMSGPAAPAYRDLVERFAGGPPAWSPFRWAPEPANLLEYVVHHEDIRRAAGDDVEPRELPAAMQQAIWKVLLPMARMINARSPLDLVLAVPNGPRQVIRRPWPFAPRRRLAMAVVGEPAELALYVMGRQDAAHVEILATAEAAGAFSAAH